MGLVPRDSVRPVRSFHTVCHLRKRMSPTIKNHKLSYERVV